VLLSCVFERSFSFFYRLFTPLPFFRGSRFLFPALPRTPLLFFFKRSGGASLGFLIDFLVARGLMRKAGGLPARPCSIMKVRPAASLMRSIAAQTGGLIGARIKVFWARSHQLDH
jgi:hypothetical protein